MTALLDHLWQSTLFALAALLLTWMLHGNRAEIRYGLWLAASVKFLIPFSLLVTFASEIILPHTAPITNSPNAYYVQEAVQPFAATGLSAAVSSGPDWSAVFFVLWAAGCAGILAVWLVRSVRLGLILRDAVASPIAAPARVKISSSSMEPSLVGLWRPVLLLPQGIAERLTLGELNAIVAHELCHLRRRDNLTAALHMLVVALFWFYPLVWWIGARLVQERELACDRGVVESGNNPQDYAQGILKVCQSYFQSPLSCASGISGANLRKRIGAIMADRFVHPLDPARQLLLAASAAIMLAAPLFMGLSAPPLVVASEAPWPQTIRSSPVWQHLFAEQGRPRQAIPLLPAAFDRYTGYYRFGPQAIGALTRSGNHVFARMNWQQPVEYYPASPTEYFSNQVHAQITFETDSRGRVTALLLHQGGIIARAQRMDDNDGRNQQALLDQRFRDHIKNNVASPGTEASLRRYIVSLENGRPNYEEMRPGMAENVREELPAVAPRLKNWRALKSVRFDHVGPDGMDIYDVRFANGSVEWRISPLGSDGKVQGRQMLSQLRFHFGGGLLD